MGWFAPLLSLAGGLFGANKDAKARKRSDWMNSPQGIRANAEEAGFNPLAFVGPGTGTGAQYAPTMGTTIANSFAAASDQMQEAEALKIQRAELEQENERLRKLTERTTLTPKVKGIYGNAKRVSGNSGDTGVSNGSGNFGSTSWVAPGRETDVGDYVSGPGVTEINNKYTGQGVWVPGDDGEPWGIDEVATAAIVGVPQLAAQAWSAFKTNRELAPYEKGWREWKKRQDERSKKQKRGDRRKRRGQ